MNKTCSLLLAFALAACANSNSKTDSPPDPWATVGDEDPLASADLAETSGAALDEEATDDSATNRRGQLNVKVMINEEPLTVPVKILGEDDKIVAQGSAGDTFTLPPGQYVASAEVTNDEMLVDTPERRSEVVEVRPTENQTATVEFGRARVRLQVLKSGKKVRGSRVVLRRSGGEETVLDFEPNDDHISISPGRYDAVVHLGKDEISVTGLVFMGGATQTVPIRVK